MCGIFYINNGTCEAAMKTLEILRHRGPDEQSYNITKKGIIGTARLSIVDITRGKQPLSTPDNRYTIVFNGEIFNYKELKEKLEKNGYKFRTSSDTELVIALFTDRKNNTPKELDGQFAYIIVDNKTGALYAARDHFGIRPIYFGFADIGIVVSSEIKALIKNGVDENKIRRLPQGCSFEYQNKKVKIRRYYDVRNHIGKEKANPEKLLYLLNNAVKKQIPNEVKYATTLAGLDSSIITYLTMRQKKKPVITYTVGTSTNSLDARNARILSKKLGIKNRFCLIDEKYVIEKLPVVIKHMETFLYFPLINAIPELKVAEMAQEDGVKVILTGTGSDDVNIGYRYLWEQFDPNRMKENALILISTIGEHELYRDDRILLSQSIEGRVPFLDKKYVEHVLSTPFEERLKKVSSDFEEKAILKKAMYGKLPNIIVNRKKEGFHQSVGMIPLMNKVADRLMTDDCYKKYMDSLKGTGWEKWIWNKACAVFHREWSKQYPELSSMSPSLISNKSRDVPDINDLKMLSKWQVTFGGGINLHGWNRKII